MKLTPIMKVLPQVPQVKALPQEWPTQDWPEYDLSFFKPETFFAKGEKKWFAELEKLQEQQTKIIDQKKKWFAEHDKKERWAGDLRVIREEK